MHRRTFVATCASGLSMAIAGCSGGEPEETPTTTAATTSETPTTTEEPTTTPEPTTQTTTGAPAFEVAIEAVDPADREVWDGTATVTARVRNVGTAAGEHTATVALRHRYLDREYAQTVPVTLGAGESQRLRLRADFRTTGVYDLFLDGERVGAVDVERLSAGGGGGSHTQTSTTDPTIQVVARGNVTAR